MTLLSGLKGHMVTHPAASSDQPDKPAKQASAQEAVQEWTTELAQGSMQTWAVYARYSQLGLEMVSPIVLGLLLDYGLNTMPWGTIVGAIMGLVVGFIRLQKLMQLENRPARQTQASSDDAPPGPMK